MLEILRTELDFIEKGGYGRSVRTPWHEKSVFQDSLSCMNYEQPERPTPCSDCHLIDFVPGESRAQDVPCHFIPLNESGETLQELESSDNQHHLEEAMKQWLRVQIKELEKERDAA
jgi:hypothetical protein